jgi:uncharacterized RDD family membrane protein YckC
VLTQYRAGVQSATLGRRAAAIIVDWLASTGVMVLALGAAAYLTTDGAFAILGIFYAEIVIFTAILGGSFGQLLLGLRVVSINGGRLAFWRIALRTLLICMVIPAVIVDRDGRGLQDRAVGSIVISTRT